MNNIFTKILNILGLILKIEYLIKRKYNIKNSTSIINFSN